MKLPWMKPRARNRRAWSWRRLMRAVLNAEETYVFGGLIVLSVGVGVMVGAGLGAYFGLGATLAVFGFGAFGVGMWMLTPARTEQ